MRLSAGPQELSGRSVGNFLSCALTSVGRDAFIPFLRPIDKNANVMVGAGIAIVDHEEVNLRLEAMNGRITRLK